MIAKLALITFVVYQAYPALSQQQGASPSQPFVPGGWFRPLYSAAAEAWRDYLIRAQQATNQFYQQWANITGMNNPAGGLGGWGGLYGGGIQQQGTTGQTPQRPLQGIFSPSNIPTGLDMSELLPGNKKPGREGQNIQAPLQDTMQEETSPAKAQPIQSQLAPPAQQSPVAQQAPSVQQTRPVQQTAQAQPNPQLDVQQQPPQQAQQQQPQQQQQPSTQTQVQGRPLQTLTQPANTVGMFAGANPIGWIG